MHFLDFSSESADYYVLLVKMTVCTFYAQLGNFWEITKITSFWGNSWRFSAGKKLPASVEKSFSFRNNRLCICTVFSSPSSATFTEET